MSRLDRSRRMVIGVLLGTLVSLTAASIATGSNAALTITGGARTVSLSDLTFPSVSYSNEDQTTSGTLTLNVADESGTGEGWNVTLQASDLAYTGALNGDDIPAGNLEVTSANPPSWESGQELDGGNGPTVPASGAIGSLDVPRKVLHAQPGFGMGAYSQTLNVGLKVPGASVVGTYSATLTVTINAGP